MRTDGTATCVRCGTTHTATADTQAKADAYAAIKARTCAQNDDQRTRGREIAERQAQKRAEERAAIEARKLERQQEKVANDAKKRGKR